MGMPVHELRVWVFVLVEEDGGEGAIGRGCNSSRDAGMGSFSLDKIMYSAFDCGEEEEASHKAF